MSVRGLAIGILLVAIAVAGFCGEARSVQSESFFVGMNQFAGIDLRYRVGTGGEFLVRLLPSRTWEFGGSTNDTSLALGFFGFPFLDHQDLAVAGIQLGFLSQLSPWASYQRTAGGLQIEIYGLRLDLLPSAGWTVVVGRGLRIDATVGFGLKVQFYSELAGSPPVRVSGSYRANIAVGVSP